MSPKTLATLNKLFSGARDQFQQNPEQAQQRLLKSPSVLKHMNVYVWRRNKMLSFQVLPESVSQKRHYEVIKAGASDLYAKHTQ